MKTSRFASPEVRQDGVSDSSGNSSEFSFAHCEVETNVPEPAYALPYGRATAWQGGRLPWRSCACATETGSTTNILATGGSGA